MGWLRLHSMMAGALVVILGGSAVAGWRPPRGDRDAQAQPMTVRDNAAAYKPSYARYTGYHALPVLFGTVGSRGGRTHLGGGYRHGK